MDDVSLAAELVREAGTLASDMLAAGLETEYKTSVSDVVSAADHAAEELVTARLAEHRADDGLVGEEGARRTGDGRIWYIDPVDGTYNFLSGIPYWCSAVGLADEDGPAGRRGLLPGAGPALGRRPRPSDHARTAYRWPRLVDRPLAEVSVATYFHPRHMADQDRLASWQAVTAAAATVRMLGSASVDLAEVASGRLGIFLQANLHPWDWYPGAALVLGAGGVAEEFAGRRQSAGRSPATVRRSTTPRPPSRCTRTPAVLRNCRQIAVSGEAAVCRQSQSGRQRSGSGALLGHAGHRGRVAELSTARRPRPAAPPSYAPSRARVCRVATTIDSASTRK